MASYEYFHPGSPYSLEPTNVYGDSSAYMPKVAELGLPTDPRLATQIQAVSDRLNTGMKTIEAGALSADVFESIPKQHFKEINRLTKLTGADVSLHGPMIEASGYTKEGWSEADRQGSERQIKNVVERAHDMSPDGNIPVTFHSSAGLPEGLELVREKVDGEWKSVPKSMLIVDPRTGRIDQLKETGRYFPEEGEKFIPGKAKKFDQVAELRRKNNDSWTESVSQINFGLIRGEEMLKGVPKEQFEKWEQVKKNPQEFAKLPEEEQNVIKHARSYEEHAEITLRDSYRGMRELFNMAYAAAKRENDADAIKKLDEYAKKVAPRITDKKEMENTQIFAEIIRDGVKTLSSVNPKIFQPLNDFLVEKSSQTFANAAFYGYKKFGDKAPLISIENPPAGAAISRAEDLKKLVEKSREEFVNQAKKEGISESEAKAASEKLIGATWDVGHINMIRKFGYGKEELIKEAETISPFVKHVHLSDNFGYEHTELPMGMGNVPMKEIMEKLGKEGFSGKKIIEAGNWWQHMKTPPVVPTLEAFGSQMYSVAGPTWAQAAGTYGSYFAFPSAYLPEQHFSMYGGGFSGLPQELGGQIPGKQSRMTGTPMD